MYFKSIFEYLALCTVGVYLVGSTLVNIIYMLIRTIYIQLVNTGAKGLMWDFWDARWQQTYQVNPLFSVTCAHAQNYVNNGDLPGKSAAT